MTEDAEDKATILNKISIGLESIRERSPLIHNITNYVVMNSTANTLLSLGASPVMAHAAEEVEEMVGLAGALVINIGTLSTLWVESMFKAAMAARKRSIPWILDPVGAGATRYRTEVAQRLLGEFHPTIVRGNGSEIMALAGAGSTTKGVDSTQGAAEALSAASNLAGSYRTIVAVTGPEDYVTDGGRSVRISNGHPLMSRITGSGCAATAIVGAFSAVEPDALVAATGALATFGIAGELAAQSNPGPGTFQVLLLDALNAVTRDIVIERARITLL